MVRVDSDEGIGRRLPPWMLRVPGDDRVGRFKDVDGVKKHPEEKKDSQTSQTKETSSIRHPRKSAWLKRKEILMGDSCIPKRESKRRKGRKRKSSQAEPEVPDAVPEKLCNRLGGKSLDSALAERDRPEDSGNGSSLIVQGQAEANFDDDMELTVEDLMIIAKEYVETDENRAGTLTFYGERESSSSLNQRISYTRNQSERCFSAPNADSKHSSLNCKTSVPQDSPSISDGLKLDIGIRRTGDPAKDMLDLFLGPLLKKSPENEKSEFASTDMQFSHDLEIQSQRHSDNVEVASVMKKKSSLKDKVAIFLG